MAHNLTDCAGAQAPAVAPEDTRPGARRNRIDALLRDAQQRLQQAGSTSPRLDAELLLARVLGKPRSHLLAWPEQALDAGSQQRYWQLQRRAAAGEPLAYLLGEREFWSLPLVVTPEVLIPRPETELLVERCLALLSEMDATGTCAEAAARTGAAAQAGARVCDLGTGSGAIALALAVERPAWHITATDSSRTALRVARANARRLDVHNVEFLEGDWFTPLAARRFDLIASNPPYVAAADPSLARLRYEPREALTPGVSGLEALFQIIEHAAAHLRPQSWLALEHGAAQASQIAEHLAAAGFVRIRSHRDLAGQPRVTEAQWPR